MVGLVKKLLNNNVFVICESMELTNGHFKTCSNVCIDVFVRNKLTI